MATETQASGKRFCNPCAAMFPVSGERSLEWKLRGIALALVLILAGTLLAVPGNQWQWFVLGIGTIFLIRIVVQRLGRIRVSRRDLLVAGVALAAGAVGLALPEWPFAAVVLVAAGVALLGAAALGRGTRPS